MISSANSNGLNQLSKEMERNWLRARNGIRLFSGQGYVRSEVTERDLMWSARKAALWRYRSSAQRRFATPVLMYIGLVSRSYLFDLQKGNSFVARLMDLGFDVYLLDWGIPDEADAENTIGTYAHELLPSAIRAVIRTSGAKDVNLMAYCMGGCLTLSMLGTRDDIPVRSLITMATPVDYSQMGEFFDPAKGSNFDIDLAIDESGNLPANVIKSMINIRRPTSELVQYVNLWQNLWNDEFLDGYEPMREWIADHISFPGGAFREVLQMWLRNNGFMTGNLSVAGKRLDLSRITCPTLCLIAEHDEMVPMAAALPIANLLTGTTAHVEIIKAGHISLTCGRGMDRKTLPVLKSWLDNHSEELENG